METVRLHVQDSFYALLVCFLKLGSRDIKADFNIAWTQADRSVSLDGTSFNIAKRFPGQPHEIPGVNLVFYEEQPLVATPSQNHFSRLVTIHVYQIVSDNPNADDRTLLKIQNQVDKALYWKGASVVDFYSAPAVALTGTNISWDILVAMQSWLELTDLAKSNYLHRARSLHLTYRDFSIS